MARQALGRTRTDEQYDLKHTGAEPEGVSITNEIELLKALNWHSKNDSDIQRMKNCIEWATANNDMELLHALSKLNIIFLPSSFSSMARLDMVCSLSDDFKLRLLLKRDEVLKLVPEEKEEVQRTRTVVDKYTVAASHFDSLLDAAQYDENIVDYLNNLSPSRDALSRLHDHYAPIAAEMDEVIKAQDYELVHAYNYMSKPAKLARQAFMHRILKATDVGSNVVKLRTRKKKAIPPEKQVAKLLYLESDAETGIKSVKPTKLIGANKAWLFATDKRKLVRYIAGEGGFMVKGTSILNVGIASAKTVRKPKEFLATFMASGPKAQDKLFDNIRSVDQGYTNRTSRNSLILVVR
jgi:hypothetical protein